MSQPGSFQFHGPALRTATMQNQRGVRTRVLLVATMAFIIASVTACSLLLVRRGLRSHVTDDLSNDLARSVVTFQNLQTDRLAALERENALLADLPSLKAMMTTSDDLTIRDGAVEFWKVSGNDLLALADATGRVIAVNTSGTTPDNTLRAELQNVIESPAKHYLVGDGRLFACSVQPIYFGSRESGTLLGYVVSGSALEARTVRQISDPTGVDVAFLSGGKMLASSLDPSLRSALGSQLASIHEAHPEASTVKLGNERYLSAVENLSANATAPLQLVVLKSFGPAEQAIQRIDRLVLIAGLIALFLGTALMVALSRVVTRPIEELAEGVRAFGLGDVAHLVPRRGTYEVRQLSAIFAGMRDEIQHANRALLESERLATIGRMANSVSHDLRHYLAAVYANAEFLASGQLSAQERAEIFADIRMAVHGTTEMIESLLIFSRTGASMRRSPELMAMLLERALTLVRAHPDAEDVTFVTRTQEPRDTAATVDGKQIERAIYNLLLNASQAAHATGAHAEVITTLETRGGQIILNVIDNGPGVPESIRKTLFDPFISEGKQKGTGLGLTLAQRIAIEHGGDVVLLTSRPGETIFQMKVTQEIQTSPMASSMDRDKVATR